VCDGREIRLNTMLELGRKSHKMSTRFQGLISTFSGLRRVVAGLAVAGVLRGMFVMPLPVPVDRLVASAQEAVVRNPQDTDAYYRLGRIHYLALALKARSISDGGRRGGLIRGNSYGPNGGIPLTREELERHYLESVRDLLEAVQRAPDTDYFHLTLACVYEEGAKLGDDVAAERQRAALAEYKTAFQLSLNGDSSLKTQPNFNGLYELVSYEAATSYLRLVEAAKATPDPDAQQAMQAQVARLKALPSSRVVTPIVFALKRHVSLDELVDQSHAVAFDLDGTGRPQSWTWLGRDAALLVWDPEHTGSITSGRQLFGNVSWWIFWNDGYQALAALDDDQDGWLRGKELTGLALWFDRNQNGRSDPGEVVPIEQTEIEALAVQPDCTEPDGSWRASAGVLLKNGTTLPSWDWLARNTGTR
jgi:hypothetical protein